MAAQRTHNLRTAVRLSAASVLWNVVAGVAATTAGLLAGSLALIGFGLDSAVDGAASCVLIWRFVSESRDASRADALERRASRVVAVALILIGAYVGVRALIALTTHSEAGSTATGIVIAAASALVLPPLAYAKRRTARRLDSRALRGDSVLTGMGAVLAMAALLGLASSRLFGWWWADSAVALGIGIVLGRESVRLIRSP
jgi:divalent metal cation (Fe/Co/Zn/Cd) transporter